MTYQLTPAQREAYARAKTTLIHLWSLEFRHPAFGVPLRMVGYDARDDLLLPLEDGAPVDGGTTQAFACLAVDVPEPVINTEADTQIRIQIDGVPGAIQPYLSSANETSIPINVTVRPYAYDVATKAIEGPMGVMHLQVRNVGFSGTSVAVVLGYTNPANRSFPSANYTPETNPGLV